MLIRKLNCGVFLLLAAQILLIIGTANAYADNSILGWAQEAKSYQRMFRLSAHKEQPLLVYFYSDNCEACRELNWKYFEHKDFKQFLTKINNVQLNPQRSESERNLAEHYKAVAGQPGVYVLIPGITRPEMVKLPLAEKASDASREVLLERIQAIIAKAYNLKGYQLDKNGRSKPARLYFQKTLKYCPNDVYALFMLARGYHKEGSRLQSEERLNQAKHYYELVLSIDPHHKKSKAGLKSLAHL
jgi:tetratricopeptide (TPR) repeat protein